MLRGSQPEVLVETRTLLRRRIRVGAVIVFFAVATFLARDLILGQAPSDAWARLGLLGVAGVIAALLAHRPGLGWRQLRFMEIVLFWMLGLWLASDRYYQTLRAAAREDVPGVLFAVAFAVLAYFALAVGYGILVPNTWIRTLRVTVVTAAMPFGVLWLLRLRSPAAYDFVRQTLSVSQLSSLVLMLGVGVAIAAAGTHRLQVLREAAAAAQELGQYRLTRRIGGGGMGEVWEAEHRLLARPAAVKLIRPSMVDARDPERASAILRSFEREARTTAMLRSVHTIELYDFGVTEDGSFYYVMELLDGYDLRSLVEACGALPAARTVHLLQQACASLAEAHALGLAHRDLKPSNIFVCRMGRAYDFVKVLDFGLVRSWRTDLAADGAREGSRLMAGTPAFMAPEATTGGRDVDGRADIYALGCVAYWMLTGALVFPAGDPREMLNQHLISRPVPPSRRSGQQIPQDLETVVLGCLEKDPLARPQSAEELAERLAVCDVGEVWSQARAREWWEQQSVLG